MAAAPTLAWLFVGRLIAGVAGATYGPANAVLADVTPPEKRGATFGLMGAAFGLGFILGPAIGGLTRGLRHARALHRRRLARRSQRAVDRDSPARDPAAPSGAGRSAGARPMSSARSGRSSMPAAPRRCWSPPCSGSSAISSIRRPGPSGPGSRCIGTRRRSAGRSPPPASPWRSRRVFVTGRAIARFGEARTVVIGMIVGGAELPALCLRDARAGGLCDHLLQRAAGPGLAVDERLAVADDRRLAPGRAAGRHGEHRQHRRDHRPAGDDPGARPSAPSAASRAAPSCSRPCWCFARC